jgi:hypothetical protein
MGRRKIDRTRRTEYMSLSDLLPALVNPKRHDDGEIDGSLNRFGYIEPIVLDERTGRILAGHGRIAALARAEQEGGPPEGVEVGDAGWLVPVNRGWASKNDAEATAAGIALNRIPEVGGWDRRELAAILGGLKEADLLAGVGYSAEQVDALVKATTALPPDEFRAYDDDLHTDHVCPRCGYQF